jgi:hypothetical protein
MRPHWWRRSFQGWDHRSQLHPPLRQVSKTGTFRVADQPPGTVPEGDIFLISRGCMLGRRRSIITRDFQSSLAKTLDQVLGEFGIPPLPEFAMRNDGEVRSYR